MSDDTRSTRAAAAPQGGGRRTDAGSGGAPANPDPRAPLAAPVLPPARTAPPAPPECTAPSASSAQSAASAPLAGAEPARPFSAAGAEQERPITLLIVDDHPVVRNGLHGMFDSTAGFTVLGEAGGGVEAVEMVGRLDPDVVLMDLRMPGGGGVDAIKEMARRGARAKVLVLTTFDTDSDTLPAIEAGATGYLLKDAPPEELFTAVRAAADGRTVLSPAVASRLVSAVRSPAPPPGGEALSSREREVLALVAKGTSNREIARVLFISEATVKTHLTHIYAKLDVSDRAAAVAVAYDRGILGTASPGT